MKKKQFENMLIKNLLSVMLPCIAVLTLLICVLVRVTDINDLDAAEADNEMEALKMYAEGVQNFEINARELKYTGFDCKADGEVTGRYYYRITDGRMYIYLINEKLAEKLDEGGVLSGSIRLSIVQDNPTASYIIGQYADYLGITYNETVGFVSPYIFSNQDYPVLRIILTNGILALLAIMLLAFIIITFTGVVHTDKNPMASELKKYGQKAAIIEALNGQLLNHVLYRDKNVYVTDDYLIVSYISKTEVVKLDFIEALSKHAEKKKRMFRKPLKIYRLTATNSDGLHFECEFADEDVIDDVIYYIRGE